MRYTSLKSLVKLKRHCGSCLVLSSVYSDWREAVKYHQYVPPQTAELLDALQDIYPLSSLSENPESIYYDQAPDHLVDLGRWLDDAVDAGILTSRERQSIRYSISQHI